ncbi:MAG: hypothetical protein KF730_07380 [Sphingomonas sp.]|uniref:hypothetical protein n=1 Tax=Sphingomonas sp. TaxID=28214 RepID=UPI0025F4ADC5|nr:hypothetical protein [Sphingomonas sp.]MBX3564383.1 hypothetical protein [Sphingomonas sp.]
MTDTATATMRRHVHAITRMLLGDQVLKPGLAITAGQVLTPAGVARIARLAHDSQTDLIHLDFAIDGDIATLNDIIIAAPRDNNCFVYTRCQLAQIRGKRHAMILPQAAARGHFRILPNEIVHMPNKPTKLTTEGMAFAAQRLNRLVRDDVQTSGQIDLFEVLQNA